MADPEKTVEGLKQVYLHFERMTEISYDGDSARFEELKEWTGDALELLKRQEPMQVVTEGNDVVYLGRCPACNRVLAPSWGANYCSACGQAVKWDG